MAVARLAGGEALIRALANALGVRAVVEKRRELYLVGQTRIHFDDVAGLGQFIELEVVLRPTQDPEEGVAIAERLMAELGIEPTDLVAAA